MRVSATLAAATLTLALAACSASSTPDGTASASPSSATMPAATTTPAASPSAAASASSTPLPSDGTDGGGETTVTVDTASASNDFGTTDPEEVFAQTYGSLGESDGVIVEHSSLTTEDGVPLLIVEVSPVEGNGGDSTLTFFALYDDAVVQGVFTSPDGIDDAQRSLFESEARAAVHP